MSPGHSPGKLYKWLHDNKVTEDRLWDLALELYRLYVVSRQALYPEYRMQSTPPRPEKWVSVAQQVIEEQADPLSWVRAQFDEADGEYPHPNQMSGEIARDKYHKWIRNFKDAAPTVDEQLTLFCRSFEEIRDKNPHRGLEDILSDTRMSFGALFVWCMAKSLGLEDLASRHEKNAKTLLLRPAYRTSYSKLFPEVLEDNG